MDNVTHSLIGIAAAEPLAIRRRRDRVLLWATSALANNLPDLDVLYAGHGGGRGEKLGYLLHHRGYTHTILLAPLQSLLFLGALWLVLRRRPNVPWRAVGALAFLGPLLHLFADSWNSYGVHPFWPYDNHWYYGDLVFIVEPWLWAIFLPLVWKRSERWWSKGVALALLTFLVVVCWRHSFVAGGAALAVTIFSLFWLAANWLLGSDRARITAAFSLTAMLFGTFGWAELKLKRAFAGEGSVQAYLAHPANPFCWTVLTAGFSGEEYRARAWNASPWPSYRDATTCPQPMSRNGYSGLAPPGEASGGVSEKLFLGDFRSSRTELANVLLSCRARAFLRFARIPFWRRDGDQWRIGDLRFDRGGPSFADLSVKPSDPCPSLDAPWEGPFFSSGS